MERLPGIEHVRPLCRRHFGHAAEQTKSILAQIDGFLARAGTDKSKLLSANIWITDMAKFAEMNAVWDAWVAPGHTPARATVEAGLASPDYLVEIMVVGGK